jgi:hypothetical protein
VCQFPHAGPEALDSAPAELSAQELIEVAKKVALGGTGYPMIGPHEPKVEKLTNQLVYDARTAVHEVFSTSRSSVRWVRESQQLDQEESLAYVLAHLLGYELLADESRKIGELARQRAIAFKGKPPGVKGKPPKPPADQVLKDNASKANYKARADAAKDPTLADGLAQRLAHIDAVLAKDRRELARAVVALPWPPRNSVIRTAAPPKPKPPAVKLRELRLKVTQFDEEIAFADASCVALRRTTERVHVLAKEAAANRRSLTPPSASTEVWEAAVALANKYAELRRETLAEYNDSLANLRELRDAAEEARDAVCDEEEAQALARRAEAQAEADREAAAKARAQEAAVRQAEIEEDARALARREELCTYPRNERCTGCTL